MSHRVAKIQDWTDRALAKHEETADVTRRKLIIQEAIKEHTATMFPIFADLHIICDMESAKVVNSFFGNEKHSKEEAAAILDTWKVVQRLIENLIPQAQKEYFHELRRSRVTGV